MKARLTNPRIIIAILVISTLAAGLIVSVLVFATGDSRLTVKGYSDVIRFQANGVATLQVQVFDLSGKVVWDSGVVSGDTIDWDRRNDTGERLAYGAYIYSAQGWNASGNVNFQKNGKLALMPGDKGQLQAAPVGGAGFPREEPTLNNLYSKAIYDEDLIVNGNIRINGGRLMYGSDPGSLWQVGDTNVMWSDGLGNIKMQPPGGDGKVFSFEVGGNGEWRVWDRTNARSVLSYSPSIGDIVLNPLGSLRYVSDPGVLIKVGSTTMMWTDTVGNIKMQPPGGDGKIFSFEVGGAGEWRVWDRTNLRKAIAFSPASGNVLFQPSGGNVGIGTTTPNATLEVHGSATNLLALYDPVAPTDPKFRVEKTGTVLADGAYYGASFNTGSADVAERINTSEWVEAGDVVEIDPEHPGFFRKPTSAYSTKVAGIISTSPGVILGNNFDEAADDWEDNRPVLAVTGRVPCKVSAENGPIEIGDLLVASSTPGVAMKGNPEQAMGAVVGKAMEPLEDGEGTIVVQVMLR